MAKTTNQPFALLFPSAGKDLREEALEIIEALKNHTGVIYSLPVYVGQYTAGDEWGVILSFEPINTQEAEAYVNERLG